MTQTRVPASVLRLLIRLGTSASREVPLRPSLDDCRSRQKEALSGFASLSKAFFAEIESKFMKRKHSTSH